MSNEALGRVLRIPRTPCQNIGAQVERRDLKQSDRLAAMRQCYIARFLQKPMNLWACLCFASCYLD